MSFEPLLNQQYKCAGSESSFHSVEAENFFTPDSECLEEYQPQEIMQPQDQMQENLNYYLREENKETPLFSDLIDLEMMDTCPICYDQFEDDTDTIFTLTCSHKVMDNCLRDYFVNMIQKNKLEEIRCPNLGCKRLITATEISQILNEQQSKYEKLIKSKKETSNIKNKQVVYCPANMCVCILTVPQGFMNWYCRACKKQVCITCIQLLKDCICVKPVILQKPKVNLLVQQKPVIIHH